MAKVLVKTRNILTHFLPNQDFSRKLKYFLLCWGRSVSMLSVLTFSVSWELRPSASCGSAFRLGSEPLLYSDQWSSCYLRPLTNLASSSSTSLWVSSPSFGFILQASHNIFRPNVQTIKYKTLNRRNKALGTVLIFGVNKYPLYERKYGWRCTEASSLY